MIKTKSGWLRRALTMLCGLTLCFTALVASAGSAAAATFSDDFEAPAIDPFWTSILEQHGTVQLSTDQAVSGTQSLRMQAVPGGPENHAMLVGHDLAQASKGTLSVQFYDNHPGRQTLYAYLEAYGPVDGYLPHFHVGIRDSQAFQYFVNYATEAGSVSVNTGVARTLGWHEFAIVYGEGDVEFFIDGASVHSVAGDFVFDRVQLRVKAPSWRPEATYYFDDFSMHAYAANPPCLTQTLTVNNASVPPPSPLFGGGTSNGPYGAAVDSGGNMHVADPSSNTAYRFDPAGAQSLAINGVTNPDFTDPDGIAVNGVGDIYVGNPGSPAYRASVQRFDAAGNRLGFVRGDFLPVGSRFQNPRGIAVDDVAGIVYFGESGGGAARLYATPADLSSLAILIDKTDPEPDFNSVGGVAVDADGNIYVAGNYIVDPTPTYAGIVWKFDAAGNQLWTLQAPVLTPATWGVAIDASGNLFVADGGTASSSPDATAGVYGFRPSGERFLTITNASAAAPSPAFIEPRDVAVDGAGHLYVTDMWTNTLYKFEFQCNQAPTVTVDEAIVAVDEGQPALNGGTVADLDGDEVALSASVGTVANNGDGTWSWSFPTTDGPAESQTVTMVADDGNGGTAQTSFDLVVANVAPTVGPITLPAAPVAIGDQPVAVSAAFSDPAGAADEPYTCAVDYGDLTGDQAGTVAGTTCTGPDHTYAAPGVHTVSVTVTDKDGGSGSATATEFVVIYDPAGGFVTGGGWIDSPAGAYPADPDLTGKATFGFVSKYKKGASTPTGNTEFQFKAGDLNFHSDSYDWLVIAGQDKAKYKGTGTINGTGNYGFMLTAIDTGNSGDTFRIKIWDKDAGDTVVYDNKHGTGDDGYDGTVIGGGSVKVHKAK